MSFCTGFCEEMRTYIEWQWSVAECSPVMCPTAVSWGGKPVFDSGYGINQSMWEHKPWSQPDLALSLALSLPSRVVVVVVTVAALVLHGQGGVGEGWIIKHSVSGSRRQPLAVSIQKVLLWLPGSGAQLQLLS